MSTQRLFVGNLSFQTNEQQLKSYFRDVGTLVSVHIPLDPTTGRSRGFGFVEFATEAEARMAVEVFDGRRLAGRIVHVRPATDAPPRRRKPQPAQLATHHWDDTADSDDYLEQESRDHKHRRDWREQRRAKRSI